MTRVLRGIGLYAMVLALGCAPRDGEQTPHDAGASGADARGADASETESSLDATIDGSPLVDGRVPVSDAADAAVAPEACRAPNHLVGDACVAASACSAGCSGHGNCVAQQCQCESGYAGAQCEGCAIGFHRGAAAGSCTQSMCDPNPCSAGQSCDPASGRCCECTPGATECAASARRVCMTGAGGCGTWSGWSACAMGPACADSKRCSGGDGVSIEQWSGDATSDQIRGLASSADGTLLVVGRSNGSVDGQSIVGMEDAVLTGYKGGQRLWTREWGTAASDVAIAVTSDSTNSAFVAGYTDGKLGASQLGLRDAFLAKWSAEHALVWLTQWGSDATEEVTGVARGATGDLWVCGHTQGALKGQNAGRYDAFVSKLNAEGSVQWSAQLGSVENDDANQIAVDAAGNSFVVGTAGAKIGSDAAQGGSDVFLAKINAAGAVQWVRQWGSAGDDGGHELGLLSGGDLVVGGFTRATLPGAAGSGGGFVARLDAEGRARWTQQLGATNSDTVNGLAVGSGDRIYLGGVTSGSIVPNGAKGEFDAFMEARDADGQVRWTMQAGTAAQEVLLTVAVGGDGTAYAGGSTQGSFSGFTQQGGSDFMLLSVPP